MNPIKTESKKTLTLVPLANLLYTEGITVELNTITHEIEVKGVSDEFNQEDLLNDLPVILHDRLKGAFSCTKDLLADLLRIIAGQNRYNPVDRMLEGVKWDGTDRFTELCEIIGIENDSLSKTMLRKFLNAAWVLAHNDSFDPQGADGMLVLVGGQGIGKTSFVRVIGAQRGLYKLGQFVDARDKDTQRRCTSAWIVELAEIETTMRGDLERLKAFITAERDETRLPYARADRITPRRTVFVGTCNSPEFLVDPTGSRRFWTIPVNDIDRERLRDYNAVQLWAQIAFESNLQPFEYRLTPDEQAALAKRNTQHERPLKAQPEVEDILSSAESRSNAFVWEYMTVSDFKASHSSLSRYSAEQIGKALDRVGITATRKSIDGRQIRARYLPRYRWAVDRMAK